MSGQTVEFIFLKSAICMFNNDLAKLAKMLVEFNSVQTNELMQLLETVKENIESVEKRAEEIRKK
jgi:hypothetical protein